VRRSGPCAGSWNDRAARLGGQPALDIVEGEQRHDLDGGIERGKKRLQRARQDGRIGRIEDDKAAALPVNQRAVGAFSATRCLSQ